MSKKFTTSDLTDESNKYNTLKEFFDDAYQDFNATIRSMGQKMFKTGSLEYANARKILPYVIHPTSYHGVFIVLNRNYKPIYCNRETGDWVEYADFPQHMLIIDPKHFQFLAINGKNPGYLFNDATAPWNSLADAKMYLVRLQFLRQWL